MLTVVHVVGTTVTTSRLVDRRVYDTLPVNVPDPVWFDVVG